MKAADFKIFLKGLLWGVARGPVDDAIIDMIIANAPQGSSYRPTVPVDDDVDMIPPPPAGDPEGAFEQDAQPGFVTPEQIRQMRSLPKDEQKRAIKVPQTSPRARALLRPKESDTKVGKDEDLKDAASGGEVLRLG